jgi:hypothetical protein
VADAEVVAVLEAQPVRRLMAMSAASRSKRIFFIGLLHPILPYYGFCDRSAQKKCISLYQVARAKSALFEKKCQTALRIAFLLFPCKPTHQR